MVEYAVSVCFRETTEGREVVEGGSKREQRRPVGPACAPHRIIQQPHSLECVLCLQPYNSIPTILWDVVSSVDRIMYRLFSGISTSSSIVENTNQTLDSVPSSMSTE